MQALNTRAKVLGYFAQTEHMTSSFSNSGGGGQLPQVALSERLCLSGYLACAPLAVHNLVPSHIYCR